MILRFIILSIVLNGCNPLLGTGSFVHSVVTENTVGQVMGISNIVLKNRTGKNFSQHILQ